MKPIQKICKTCRKRGTSRCDVLKATGKYPSLFDYCRGWKKR